MGARTSGSRRPTGAFIAGSWCVGGARRNVVSAAALWHLREMRCNTIVGLMLLALSCLSGAGCRRQCATSANCVRECDCVDDSQNGRRLACPVTFTCDVKQELCAPEYDALSCNQICEKFAARDHCGAVLCSKDADCQRSVLCAVKNADGTQGQAFDCKPPGLTCVIDEGICVKDAQKTDAEICADTARFRCLPP